MQYQENARRFDVQPVLLEKSSSWRKGGIHNPLPGTVDCAMIVPNVCVLYKRERERPREESFQSRQRPVYVYVQN